MSWKFKVLDNEPPGASHLARICLFYKKNDSLHNFGYTKKFLKKLYLQFPGRSP